MSIGYVKLYRKIEDTGFWTSEAFTKPQAWVDLIMLANHKDSMFFVRNVEVKVKRGCLAWSEVSLSQRWKWSREKVRNFLKWLETRQQIRQQKSNVTTIIELVNYSDYQGDTDDDRTADHTANQTTDSTADQTANRTAEKQQKNSKPDTYNNEENNNNEKNVKNEKKYVGDFESLWLQYPPDNRRDKAKCKVIFDRYCTSQEKENQFKDAFLSYTQSKKFKEGFVQNSIVWFRDWQTWLDFNKFSGKTGEQSDVEDFMRRWGKGDTAIEAEVVK